MVTAGLVASLSAALILADAPPPGQASCPVDPSVGGASRNLEAHDASARLQFIAERIELGADKARAWSLGWGITYAVAAVTQLAITPLVDRGTRIDLYVGAASAGVGVLTRSISIPRVIKERRRMRRRSGSAAETCATVQQAERALVRSAHWERRGRHVLMHLAALTYNAGVGLLLGLAFDRPISGNRQAVIGATVGQVMLLSQPTITARALDDYRTGVFSPRLTVLGAGPLVLPRGGGVSITLGY